MFYLTQGKYFRFVCILLVFLFSIKPAFALVISEVHPKPTPVDGDQKGREWLEVFNDTTETIDLTEYVLSESKGERTISATGDKTLLSGEYAIIGQDFLKFKADPHNSSFNGKFFTANFAALTDGGEELIIKKNNVEVCGLKTYTSITTYDQSVHFTISGLVKNTATPGAGDLAVGTAYSQLTGIVVVDPNVEATTTEVITTYVSPTYYSKYYFPESEKIYINAGENKIGLVGADIIFEAKAITGDKKSVNANFFWSFGDGEVGEGKNVFHVYKYPGEYAVDIEGYANGNKNSVRIYIKIIEPNLKIKFGQSIIGRYVEIENNSKEELDIGGFLINSSILPKKLSILPNKSIKISEETLKLASNTLKVSLLFANGKELTNNELFITKEERRENLLKNNQVLISTSTVEVYTKENYEKLQKNLTTNLEKNQRKYVYSQNVVPRKQTNPEQITPTNYATEKFIVKKQEQNMLQSLLKYFGI